MKQFFTRHGALDLIAKTPKGTARADLLRNENLRSAVLSSGANVTIYSGDITPNASNVGDKLANVSVGLVVRKNRQGKLDGLGALGGLAERTDSSDFESMSDSDRRNLVGVKDDVIEIDGTPVLITDIDIIRRKNVLREFREELADLSIDDIVINVDDLELVPMPHVKDDNFIINIWNGVGNCFAVTPYCHIYKDKTGVIDKICLRATEKNGGEASGYKKIGLVDALCAYGNVATSDIRLEDGRDAVRDFRYPHEYLTCWALASKLLNNPLELLELANLVQQKSNHPVSFERMALATSQSIENIAQILQVNPEILKKADAQMAKIFADKVAVSAMAKTGSAKE